jgi:hypothetical protein
MTSASDRADKADKTAEANRLRAKSSTFWLALSTFALFLTVGFIGIQSFRVADNNHDALCTFRADLDTRVQQTIVFIEEHPEGFAGIPASVLKNQVENQSRTLDALDTLNC